MAKSSNTGGPKSSNTAEPKARRAPARRRTDKAAAAATSGHAAEMATVSAPAELATPMIPGHAVFPALTAASGAPRANGPSPEQIQRRAYEIYLERGGTDGQDMADWLEAERQLRGH